MKCSVYIATSLDGFIARKDGELDWLPGSDGTAAADPEDFGYDSFMQSVDALVLGRNTFEFVAATGLWPYGKKTVIVLSSTLKGLPDGIPDSVELHDASPKELHQELVRRGLQHVYVDGGKTIQGFLREGLIDELIVTTVPVLIGTGIPLFGPLERDQKVIHVETKSFSNGFVQSRYKINGNGSS